ncbi:NAD-binding protein [bacterium]|nr:NAD-binding protein [bacterium]
MQVKKIWRWITRYSHLNWLFGYIFILLVLVILISYVEVRSNERFDSIWNVIYFTIITIATVGYGDITPVTVAGKILTVLLVSLGVVIISILTGSIASILTASRIREGMGLKKVQFSGHVIICGFNFNIDRIILGIVMAPAHAIPDIVLVNARPDAEITPLIERFPEATIRFVSGDYTQESTLKRAAVDEASSAIILADSGPDGTGKADDRTLLTTLTIKSLAHEVDVCAELLDPANEAHLKRAGVDQIVLSGEFNGFLLSSSVTAPGITQALREIMRIREGSDLRRIPMPRELIGIKFRDAVIQFLDRDGSILLGVVTEKKTFNMEEMLTGDKSTIDDFIRRKFDEAGRSLEIESKGRVSVHMNPGMDYCITEDDFAIILTPKQEETAK